jgi:hypothetical protein
VTYVTVIFAEVYAESFTSLNLQKDTFKIFFPLLSRASEILLHLWRRRVYPKVSGLASWSENCKWYSSLTIGAVISLFCESF